MAKKQPARARATAKPKPSKPPKPAKAPKKTGGGGRDEEKRAASVMDSTAEKKSLLERHIVFEANHTWIGPPKNDHLGIDLTLEEWLTKLRVPWEIQEDEVVMRKNQLFTLLWRFTSTALGSTSGSNASGRVVADLVHEILSDWPTKENFHNCVTDRIRKIRDVNEGFKKRWLGEIHMKGVRRNRLGVHKKIEDFVRDAEERLGHLHLEVVRALMGAEAPVAKKEAKVVVKWLLSIPGLKQAIKNARLGTDHLRSATNIDIKVKESMRADLPAYFTQVFRPALEFGLWLKLPYLSGLKFGDYTAVMMTILRSIVLKRIDGFGGVA